MIEAIYYSPTMVSTSDRVHTCSSGHWTFISTDLKVVWDNNSHFLYRLYTKIK